MEESQKIRTRKQYLTQVIFLPFLGWCFIAKRQEPDSPRQSMIDGGDQKKLRLQADESVEVADKVSGGPARRRGGGFSCSVLSSQALGLSVSTLHARGLGTQQQTAGSIERISEK